jgi:hypothetical protein
MVLDALHISGVNLDTLSPVDLAPIDEFHMGGRAATQYVIGMMQLRVAQLFSMWAAAWVVWPAISPLNADAVR